MKDFFAMELGDPKGLTAADILAIADNQPILSPSLSEAIKDNKKIIIIVGRGISRELLEAVLERCIEKVSFIVFFGKNIIIDEKYNDKVLDINPNNIDDYSYFGVTNAKTPLIIHNAFTECDAVIALAEIAYDELCGFYGSPQLIFPMFAAEKSQSNFWKKGLDVDRKEKLSTCIPAQIKGNPLDKDIKEALVSLSARGIIFGINLITKGGEVCEVFCGDILLSYVLGVEAYNKHNIFKIEKILDGILLETNKTCLQDIVCDISSSLTGLMKGGRLLINAPKMEIFGSGEFRECFNTHGLEDVFDKSLTSASVRDVYDAFLLKKLCSLYHIGIISLLDEEEVRICGMNKIAVQDEDFLKNCSEVGRVINAARFTNN